MQNTLESRVEAVDKLQGGILVTLENGKSSIFSAALLYSMLSHAIELTDDIEDEV